MKIGMKLGIAFAVLTAIILILIYLGINTASTLNESVQNLAKDRFPKTVWANNIIDAINEGARALRNALLTEDIKERDAQIERAQATTPKVRVYLDSLTATVKSEEGIKLLDDLSKIRAQYIKDRQMLFDLIAADSKKDAIELLFGDFRKSQNAYLDKINEIINYQAELFNESALEAENTYNAQFNLLLILGAIAFILAIVLAVVVTKGITKPLNTGVNVAEEIAKGNTNVNVEITSKDETAVLLNSMKSMATTIKGIITEVNTTAKMASDGKLDYRADVTKYQGDYKELMSAFNSALDALIKPINVTAEYVDRISKGDMPPKITDEYKGDFNEIKNNLNQCIDAVEALIKDANMLSKAAVEGRLDTRADASKHQGDFRAIVQGVNDTLDAVIGPLNVAAEYVDRIAKGDIPPKITKEYNGDFNEIKNNLNMCIDAVNALVSDANMLSKAGVEGRLDTRADASKHQGDFRKIVQGVNDTLDAVIGPLNVAAEYVDRIAKGDIPPKITKEYNGDFNEIKNNLNMCIDAVNALVSDANMLSKAAVEGRLDTRADASKHQGDFRKIVQGVNDTLDAVIGPLNVAAEYVDRIAKGDIPPKITKEYNGDFNEIKNNLNMAIDAVNLLVSDAKMLANAAVDGQLQTRADASKHQGDFRKIVQGVNETLDAVIGPINEASEVLSILASGDLRARVKGEYKGDLSKLKNDINQLADSLSALINEVNNTVSQVASAATQISATSDSLAAATQEQSAQTDDVASAVEEMSRTITENAMGATRTSEVAQKNGELANQGGSVVQQTVQKMKDIANVVGESALTIQKLGESSKQIGEIIAVIDDIADQTNLLALNAAIEAARAGEQGRGFAVVADEVRKLAERTTDATKQIANMIRGIQKETDMAVEAMNQGNQEVQKGIDLADRAGQALRDILNSTKEVLEMINQIAAASEEQSATSEEISKNVLSISKVISESSRRVEDVAHASDDMAKLTERLRNLMMQFKVGGGDMNFGSAGYEQRSIGGASKRQLSSGSVWD